MRRGSGEPEVDRELLDDVFERPHVLDSSAITRELGLAPTPWDEGVPEDRGRHPVPARRDALTRCGTVTPVTRVRVGLTGGVASGKSTVSAILRDLGAVVVDADRLAREVVAPGTEGLAEIVEAFGPGVLTASGELDRAAMGALVFADETARRRLEAIIHPRVRRRGAELEAAAGPDAVVVHDIPLLAETGQGDAFDAVVVVDVPVQTQIERMVAERGMSRADAEARVAAQASREDRRAVATYVIDNTGTLEDLRDRVTEVLEKLVSTGSTVG
jgi:dephospho-CoA kinase